MDTDGAVRHPDFDNHRMGTVFEELIRRFNERNNEEASEHFTSRDASMNSKPSSLLTGRLQSHDHGVFQSPSSLHGGQDPY